MIDATTTVQKYMSASPITISDDLTVHDAACRMFDHRIRHLPVVRDDRLVGIISDGDVAVVNSLPGVEASEVSIGFAMTSGPYTCAPTTSLLEVVRTLRERKIGSAVVMDQGELVGIFSVIDALKVFEDQIAAKA